MKSLTQFCKEKKNKDWQNMDKFIKIKRRGEATKKYTYIISWRTGKKAHRIGRLGGIDKFGIVYIGRQLNSTRIKNFWNSARGIPEHSGGNLYFGLKLNRKVKLARLYFITSEELDKTNPKEIERTWLWQYSWRYLEAPPLNRATPETK